MENIVRPRLNDYYGILLLQDKVDFAIPFLDEDIPLYVDPFLLWKSPSQMDNGLHDSIIQSFNHLGYLVNQGKEKEASELLIGLSECEAVGLGISKTRKGTRIGEKVANDILKLFSDIPQLKTNGFTHKKKYNCWLDKSQKTESATLLAILFLLFSLITQYKDVRKTIFQWNM